MRNWVFLAATTTLAACSGGGVQTVGSAAPPTGIQTGQTHSFVAPTVAKTYVGVGGSQMINYTTDARNCCNQQGTTFAGSATTVRNSGISIAYDPRDATFTLIVADPQSGAATNTRFQDPASRTNFGGAAEPQWGTPNISNPNIRYLQAGDGNPLAPYSRSGSGFIDPGTNTRPPDGDAGSAYQATTFFYEVPGSTTKYVTYAGYLRNALSFIDVSVGNTTVKQTSWRLERGAFAYGELTSNPAVPTLGTGSYTGSMLATMVYNPTLDGANGAVLPSYYQWLSGTSKLSVDFAASTANLDLAGTVFAPQVDRNSAPTTSFLAAGSTFAASGTGRIDLIKTGGFLGSFNTAAFTSPTGARSVIAIGGSSFDGGFYGPNGEEIGGGFRIVGGTPDQRIDILGAYTGRK